ncbi:MAG: GPW/gp25 family protein [Lachnospiraceae bacterium]|nr:GPW/gp25 family protein [Lachnospiraceae bacterium]
MANSDSRSFLGTGFSFPVRVDPNTGKVETASNDDDIRESIRIILGTQPGERPMCPEFGCAINRFVFGTTDYTSIMLMKQAVESALVMWEPRIKNIEVSIDHTPDEDGLLLIKIGYTVRATNNPFNLVYPFYISEGYNEAAMVK